jgi:HNH endonuclease
MAKKRKRLPQLSKDEIQNLVPCPECGAWKGTQCAEDGKPRSRNHVVRVEAALAWLGVTVRLTKKRRPDDPPNAKAVPVGKEFYESWEWKEARFAALKRHGRQCQCCGWMPGLSAGNHLVVDHIKPLRTHPQLALDPDNHQVLCNDCNMGKSYKHHDDFR